MVDAKNVSEEDSTSQFLAPRDEVASTLIISTIYLDLLFEGWKEQG